MRPTHHPSPEDKDSDSYNVIDYEGEFRRPEINNENDVENDEFFNENENENENEDNDRNETPESPRKSKYFFGMKAWGSSSSSSFEENLKHQYLKYSELPRSTLLWPILFGWWIALAYTILGGLLQLSVVGRPYAEICWRLQGFFLFPFGKFLVFEDSSRDDLGEGTWISLRARKKSTKLLDTPEPELITSLSSERNERDEKVARILWSILSALILVPAHLIASFALWLPVVTIPLAKLNFKAIRWLYNRPLDINVYTDYPPPTAEVKFLTFYSFHWYYFKYAVFGMNIVLVNLSFVIILAITFHYIFPLIGLEEPHFIIMFILSTVSIIPVSYYIGMAIASISEQSNFAVGAVLNASFGSFVELMLYFSAMRLGSLNDLIQGSVTGTLLGMMLLLPGLAMVTGGLKYKNLYFNRAATGVSSVLLLVSIVGAFTPTIFYQAYGSYLLHCQGCEGFGETLTCQACLWNKGDMDLDVVYTTATRPLMYLCAALLPIAYLIGVFFSLKTHSHIHMIKIRKDEAEEQARLQVRRSRAEKKARKKREELKKKGLPHPEEEGEVVHEVHEGEHEGGHESPHWGRIPSLLVLLVSAILFGLISEQLVKTLEPVLEKFHIPPRFAGLLFVALITSTIEFLNALIFAYHNNLTLALEIANSYCVQVALIQAPGLILMSALLNSMESKNSFLLIFPTMDLFSVILGLLIINYLSSEGKVNYFQGAALIIIYIIFIASFWFVNEADAARNQLLGFNVTVGGHHSAGH